ncbi:hypothetical protein AcW1_006432 [Taiwanofungus camphoratus]|nr:hypothetical protein AcV7_003145 [Antrodia cinnamomea]KAI0954587.1 hypothetical protein AcW1_006432 [Antrodia cinnamomea]
MSFVGLMINLRRTHLSPGAPRLQVESKLHPGYEPPLWGSLPHMILSTRGVIAANRRIHHVKSDPQERISSRQTHAPLSHHRLYDSHMHEPNFDLDLFKMLRMDLGRVWKPNRDLGSIQQH